MNFEEVLRDDEARSLFMQFLQKEYSQENLEFYLDCRRFQEIGDRKSLAKCSKAIYELFIDTNGLKAVNISANTRKDIAQALTRPTPAMFQQAQQEVLKLMETDSFVRFSQSQAYRQLCRSRIPARKRKSPETWEQDYENFSPAPPPLLPRKKTPKKVRFDIANDEPRENRNIVRARSMVSNFLENSPRLAQPARRYLRLTLPDTSCEYLSLSDGDLPLSRLVERVLAKRKLGFTRYKLYSTIDNREIDPKQPASRLNIDELRLEPTIEFVLHFPEGYLIDVETCPIKLSAAVLRIILAHFNLNWSDVELLDERGMRLAENDLMHPTSELDGRRLFVRYLSSLRTYLNLQDLNDLNDDGICIKSLRFEQYRPAKLLENSAASNRAQSSFTTVTIDNGSRRSMKPMKKPENDSLKFEQHRPSRLLETRIDPPSFLVNPEKKNRQSQSQKSEDDDHIYDVPPETFDITDLSFSDQSTTDRFLDDLMARPQSKPAVRYVCSPIKKKKMPRPLDQAENVHRAQLALIDPNKPCTPQRACYDNEEVGRRSRAGDQLRCRLQASGSCVCCDRDNVGLPCPVESFMSNRIQAHVQAGSVSREKHESPFREYLLKKRSTSVRGLNVMYTPTHSSPYYVNSSPPMLTTLSKYHRVT